MKVFQVIMHGYANIDWDWEAYDLVEHFFVSAPDEMDDAAAQEKAEEMMAARNQNYADTNGALTFHSVEVKEIAKPEDLLGKEQS